jgi:hypothetical protein
MRVKRARSARQNATKGDEKRRERAGRENGGGCTRVEVMMKSHALDDRRWRRRRCVSA